MKAEQKFRQDTARLDGHIEMGALLRGLSAAEEAQMVSKVAKVLDALPRGQRWVELKALLDRLDRNTATAGDLTLVAGCQLDLLRVLSRLQGAY